MQTLDQQDVPSAIKDIINSIAWKLLEDNQNETIFTFRKWGIFSFSITVGELRPLFSLIFGPEPLQS